MAIKSNRSLVLASRPVGVPSGENFRLETSLTEPLEQGEILIKTLYLSLDPYMRGRMSEAKSYAEPIPINGVMGAETAGVVVESKSSRYAVGEFVCCRSGWQEYFISNEDDPMTYAVDASKVPLSSYLGICGMPGRTAYFGLIKEGRPVSGETLVVSAASGAVGSVVGQIGKKLGLYVVGIAGGEKKCSYVTEVLGFDHCIDYKSANFNERLTEACPNGVDIYFESVGGAVTEAVSKLFNRDARAPICGYISNYNSIDITKERTPFHIFAELDNPPEHKFFLVFDYVADFQQANDALTDWVAKGELHYQETIVDGLEHAPEYFKWLFTGKNFGKLIVKVADH
ncbi:NADP-dependent oxidoreductase [Porticoccaceae bacterium]|nr:NADP-dependent oxidoreductase [Porticoccaceae bacterium]MDA8663373.1 NADP-dependent oxidoreductase [Porticoccaceae bacterium]MDA8682195.1 NADP-dependent oxidoreductase [Porticoccaceae bacterium]MDB2343612.1 NADP-dependent oxidoreductase [Porticoccaceae bacterium]MDB2635286.1 NADP-dependent oxidoreductase [Porticoccaceae bacterium]